MAKDAAGGSRGLLSVLSGCPPQSASVPVPSQTPAPPVVGEATIRAPRNTGYWIGADCILGWRSAHAAVVVSADFSAPVSKA